MTKFTNALSLLLLATTALYQGSANAAEYDCSETTIFDSEGNIIAHYPAECPVGETCRFDECWSEEDSSGCEGYCTPSDIEPVEPLGNIESLKDALGNPYEEYGYDCTEIHIWDEENATWITYPAECPNGETCSIDVCWSGELEDGGGCSGYCTPTDIQPVEPLESTPSQEDDYDCTEIHIWDEENNTIITQPAQCPYGQTCQFDECWSEEDSSGCSGFCTPTDIHPVKPLDNFESLKDVLANSDLVGLYFGAAWCPDTTPVTLLLDEEELPEQEGFSLVYVSSDRDAEEMEEYLRPSWVEIPYEHTDRNDLKRHFETAARMEMEALGMETRERHIPTLIIISAESQEVLTYDGVADLQQYGVRALDHWMELWFEEY